MFIFILWSVLLSVLVSLMLFMDYALFLVGILFSIRLRVVVGMYGMLLDAMVNNDGLIDYG